MARGSESRFAVGDGKGKIARRREVEESSRGTRWLLLPLLPSILLVLLIGTNYSALELIIRFHEQEVF
jgi:hypothetical protein